MKIEKGAFLTLLIVLVGSLVSTVFHMTNPVDFDKLGATILIGFLLLSIVLIPLYLRKIKWGYLAGIFLNLIIIGAGVRTVFERSYFFSLSIYNISVVIIYVVSFIGLVLNYLSFKRSDKLSIKRILRD